MFKFLLCCYFLSAANLVLSQENLKKLSYEELHVIIFDNKDQPTKLFPYLNEYYEKAAQEKSPIRLAEYYRNFIFLHPENNRISLIDSALHYAKISNDFETIGRTYVTKGAVYHNIKDYENTLANYLKGFEYISKTDNNYLKNKIKSHIGVIQNYLGNYDEAIDFLSDCSVYFASEPNEYNFQKGYIISTEGLAWSYTKTGQLKQSEQLLDNLLLFTQKTGNFPLDENYIIFKQGINNYYSKQHKKSIEKIEQTLPIIYKNEDFAWGSIGELYIAKSHWDMGEQTKALPHLLQIDKVFVDKKYTHPDLREAYELLIKYYEELNDTSKQLLYTNRLIEADNVYNTTYKHLSKHIYKQYETKDLLQAKKDLEFALYLQKNRTLIIGSISFILILTLVTFHFVKNKKNTIKARELILKIENLEHIISVNVNTEAEPQKSKAIVADDIAQTILAKLEKLENKEFYLRKDITLSKLAKKLDTNSTYLSAVINKYKDKNFASYLNELRINYIAKEILRTDSYELQKYSVDAFAEMAGYANVKSFSEAFQRELSIRPSVFIREVMKRNQVAMVA